MAFQLVFEMLMGSTSVSLALPVLSIEDCFEYLRAVHTGDLACPPELVKHQHGPAFSPIEEDGNDYCSV